MRPMLGLSWIAALFILAAGPGSVLAAEPVGHSHEACELHKGTVTMTKTRHLETVLRPDGIRIYLYSEDQKPQLMGKAVGSATLRFKDGSAKEVPLVPASTDSLVPDIFFCTMHPDQVKMQPGKCPKCGMTLVAQDHLFGAIDLKAIKPGSAKAFITVRGLGGDEPEVSFVEPIGDTSRHDVKRK
jgi:hypothetical protein